MKLVHKAWLYIVRVRDTKPELLVFEHTHVDAAVQIPAGTVEPNEDHMLAAHRELFEESGIRTASLIPFGELKREWDGAFVHAHWFCGHAPDDTPDAWLHQVTGSGEDTGMNFRCYWLPMDEWHNLFGDFKTAYPDLTHWITHET